MSQDGKLIYYSEHARELVGSTDDKIRAILEQGCLEYIPASDEERGHYLCHPIMQKNGKPYNKTTYKLKPGDKEAGGHTSCSCQGFQVRLKAWNTDPTAPRPNCSHVAALHELWKKTHHVRQGMQSTFGVASQIIAR